MRKIFPECLSLDARARDAYHLSSDVMMEHAALSIKQVLQMRREARVFDKVLILCGSGDNGADGYALARLLLGEYEVTVMACYPAQSEGAIKQRDRALKLGITIIERDYLSMRDDFPDADIYIDALFGASQRREVSPELRALIGFINNREGLKIACDIPTGLYDIPFRADITVTMGALKQALFLDDVKDAVGQVVVGNLGIPNTFYETTTNTYLLEESDLKLPFRTHQNAHKGSYGFLSVIKGEQTGASILSCLAGTRFGAGIVALVGAGDKPSEIMQMPTLSPKTTAIAIGMGLGENVKLWDVDQLQKYPLVVDADLFYEKNMMQALMHKEDIVLTPHPKEFAILLENAGFTFSKTYTISEIQHNRFDLARAFSQKFKGVLVLKGANTLIAHKGIIYVSTLGTNRLSKGGSGDVLAGMIGALLAQGYSALHAATQGVLAHSLAAKNANTNDFSFTPLDLIESLKTLR